MYIPNANRADDRATLVAFMRAHSFATLVSVLDGLPFATHLPLVVASEGDALMLRGHVARANPHWQAFGGGETLAIFTGPHAYVSPSLYEKHESVPTWNYIAAHAYGTPRTLTYDEAPEAMQRMLGEMIDSYEAAYQTQWNTLSAKYREGMLRGIVAFEMSVTRLEGKAKLSQNRSQTDQHAVAQALLRSDDPAAQATGQAMVALRRTATE